MFQIVSLHNQAFFEDSENKKGSITYTNPIEELGILKVTYYGFGTDGLEIPSTTVEIPTQDAINPSKVAKWILKKLAETFNSNDAT